MSQEQMQKFRKLPRTGMHKTPLSKGSIVPGVEGAPPRTLLKTESIVLRPGNIVVCVEADLGESGRAQFELLSPPLPPEPEEEQASLIIKKRPSGGFWDVINPKNPEEPLNEKALRKKEAEALLDQLLTEGQELSSGSSEKEDDDPIEDKYTDMDWNTLVAELEAEEMELADEMEHEDDIRAALREKVAGNKEE